MSFILKFWLTRFPLLLLSVGLCALLPRVGTTKGQQDVQLGNVSNSKVSINQRLQTIIQGDPALLRALQKQNNQLQERNIKLMDENYSLRLAAAARLAEQAAQPNATVEQKAALEALKKGDSRPGEALLTAQADQLDAKQVGREVEPTVRKQSIALRDEVSALGRVRAQLLPRLSIDPSGISVSGFDSGANMAVQLAVAHSASIAGIGTIGGAPYNCSRGSISGAVFKCACLPTVDANSQCTVLPSETLVALFKNDLHRLESAALIDPSKNLDRQRVMIIAGGKNALVRPFHSKQIEEQYRSVQGNSPLVKVLTIEKAGRVMPTLNQGGPCESPLQIGLGNCKFDAAGAILQWLQGEGKNVPPPQRRTASGEFVRFDQQEFWSRPATALGLDSTGWLYIPPQCKRAAGVCKLHVVFHGCELGQGYLPQRVGERAPPFVLQAGFNEWADASSTVILYPQALHSNGNLFSAGFNPKGCWDFWGYAEKGEAALTLGSFQTREGAQLSSVMAMVSRISGKGGTKSNSSSTTTGQPSSSPQ